MRTLDTPTIAAIQNEEAIAPFNLVWIEAKDRGSGNLHGIGFWNGLDTVDIQVVDPNTGMAIMRTYNGAGSLLEVPALPLESDLTIRTIRIVLSQIDGAVQLAVRGYDAKHAPLQIHRGFFNVETMLPVGPAVPRFIGWVNAMNINTPSVNGEGSVELSCVSHSRLLTKTNPLRRSDEQQRLRSGDRFRRHTDVAGEWLQNIHWGENKS